MRMSSHVVAGSSRFAAASTLVFSTVAFAERWMYANLTIAGAYVVWTLLFLVVSPLAFIQQIGERISVGRFRCGLTSRF